MQKTISIVVADFEIVKNSPKYHHTFQLHDKTSGVRFTDVIEINTLELQKVPENSDNTAKYNWLKFLSAEREEEFEMLSEGSPAIRKAVVELKRLSQDEEAQRLYEAREKAIRDENARLKTAINKNLRKIVKNMLDYGDSTEKILQITGLTVEDIERLRDSY